MIRISIDVEDAGLLDNLAANLHQAGYTTTSLRDSMTLKARLEKQQPAGLSPRRSKNRRTRLTAVEKKAASKAAGGKTCWRLNSSQLELITPDGRHINLSPDVCCILRAVARASEGLLSRKMLIEAMGHDFLYYDERRLEALISRLRRKLAPYTQDGFLIRAIKGRGYLFGVNLQEMEFEK
jgi:DNA-binding response OmpR family regulator